MLNLKNIVSEKREIGYVKEKEKEWVNKKESAPEKIWECQRNREWDKKADKHGKKKRDMAREKVTENVIVLKSIPYSCVCVRRVF